MQNAHIAKGTSLKNEAWTNLKKSLPSSIVSRTMVAGSSDVRSWRFVGLSSNDLELEQGIGFIDSLGLIFERFSVLSWRSDSFPSVTVVTIVTVGLDSMMEVSTPTPTTDSALGREEVVMLGIKGVSMLRIAIGLEGISAAGLEGMSAAGLEGMSAAGLEGMSAAYLEEMSLLGLEGISAAGLEEMSSAGLEGMSAADLEEMSLLGLEGMSVTGLGGISVTGLEGISAAGLEGGFSVAGLVSILAASLEEISAAGLEVFSVAVLEGMSATGLGGVSMLVMEEVTPCKEFGSVKIDVSKTVLESPSWFSSVEH